MFPRICKLNHLLILHGFQRKSTVTILVCYYPSASLMVWNFTQRHEVCQTISWYSCVIRSLIHLKLSQSCMFYPSFQITLLLCFHSSISTKDKNHEVKHFNCKPEWLSTEYIHRVTGWVAVVRTNQASLVLKFSSIQSIMSSSFPSYYFLPSLPHVVVQVSLQW